MKEQGLLEAVSGHSKGKYRFKIKYPWLQIGYKNPENTEKINIFRKYDDKNPENKPFVIQGSPNLIREGGRTVGSGRVATIIE